MRTTELHLAKWIGACAAGEAGGTLPGLLLLSRGWSFPSRLLLRLGHSAELVSAPTQPQDSAGCRKWRWAGGLCVCMGVCVYIYVCVCIYICMCIYIYTHIYLHVYRGIESPCLSTPSSPSPLLMAPNQAAADLTNLFGMVHSTVAA